MTPRRLEVRGFYLRLSSSSCASPAPADLTLIYRLAIGGAALELRGRPLPPASPAQLMLACVRSPQEGEAAVAYTSADRVLTAEDARFEVLAGRGLAAEGVFAWGGEGGWRVECRPVGSAVAEVVVLAEGGVLVRSRASAARFIGCLTKLEGIPEEGASCGPCACGACGEDWEVVGGDDDSSDGGSSDGGEWKEREDGAVEMATTRWGWKWPPV